MFREVEEELLNYLNGILPFKGFIKTNSEGINDRNDSLFYIETSEKKVSFENNNGLYIANKDYKIVIQSGTYKQDSIINLLLPKLRSKYNLKSIDYDSELIFLQETKTTLKKALFLVKFVVELTTIEHRDINDCVNCLETIC